MTSTETTLATVVEDIKAFYDPHQWHYLTVNGVDLGENRLEVQWIFVKYGEKEVMRTFVTTCSFDDTIPTLNHLIPSAWISEYELADLLGAKVQDAKTGIFLEPDAPKAPLRKAP